MDSERVKDKALLSWAQSGRAREREDGDSDKVAADKGIAIENRTESVKIPGDCPTELRKTSYLARTLASYTVERTAADITGHDRSRGDKSSHATERQASGDVYGPA